MKKILAGAITTLALTSIATAKSPNMEHQTAREHREGVRMMHDGNSRMGHGIMFGYTNEAYAGLNLTPEQRQTITDIHEQTSQAMWQHMGTMHSQGHHMQGLFATSPFDETMARKSFMVMAEAQKAMFELQLDARKKIDTALTKEQREKLNRYWGGH